jgi:hypothetical protein
VDLLLSLLVSVDHIYRRGDKEVESLLCGPKGVRWHALVGLTNVVERMLLPIGASPIFSRGYGPRERERQRESREKGKRERERERERARRRRETCRQQQCPAREPVGVAGGSAFLA